MIHARFSSVVKYSFLAEGGQEVASGHEGAT